MEINRIHVAGAMVHYQMVVERALHTWAFLSVSLMLLPTAASWNRSIEKIQTSIINYTIFTLPYLDLQTRSSAMREKRKWFRFYKESRLQQVSQFELNRIKRAIFLHINQFVWIVPNTFEMVHTIQL
jgi:hypothetical protein